MQVNTGIIPIDQSTYYTLQYQLSCALAHYDELIKIDRKKPTHLNFAFFTSRRRGGF